MSTDDLKYGMEYWREQADALSVGSKEWEKVFVNFLNYKSDYEKV